MAKLGEVIHEKYKIIKKIGQGGMCDVYLSSNCDDNSLWAVKEVRKISNDNNQKIVAQSLMTEAKLMKSLKHAALPKIDDIFEEGNKIFLVMEYIDGTALDEVLEQHGKQSQEKVMDWAMQLCSVLNYLHSQKPPIIYRDMKPANVMLTQDGNVKLIDFGIAREYKEDNVADTVNLGTKGYAAPEQFGGNGQTDQRTDIYSLGVTMYHLVTGKSPCEPPYELYPIRHWDSNLSVGLERVINGCTQKNPQDRYQVCADVMYALKQCPKIDEAERKKLHNRVGSLLRKLHSKKDEKASAAQDVIQGMQENNSINNTTLLSQSDILTQGQSYETTLLPSEAVPEVSGIGTSLLVDETQEECQTSILNMSTEKVRRSKKTSDSIKKITYDFKIIESVTLIHTKEQIV